MAAPRPSAKTSRRTSPFTSEKTSSPEMATSGVRLTDQENRARSTVALSSGVRMDHQPSASGPELASVKAPRALPHVADAIATRELSSVNQLVSPSPPTIDRAVDVCAGAEDTPRDPAKNSATTSSRHHTSVATGRGFGGAFGRGAAATGAACCHWGAHWAGGCQGRGGGRGPGAEGGPHCGGAGGGGPPDQPGRRGSGVTPTRIP